MPTRFVRLSRFGPPAAALALSWALALATAGATPALAAGAESGATPQGGAEAGDTLSGSPLLSADSAAERRCLADASNLRKLITIYTGRRPQNTSYSADYDDIVQACRDGRYAEAQDKAAVIWASLTLHLPHRS